MLDKEKLLDLLSEDGPLSRLLKNYESREEQRAMMETVIDAFNQNQIALIEAGTGTGKSLAYLIPAIVWAMQKSERTLISTNTITLQEQLLKKDIPLVTKAIGIPIKAVLVKGMSNYLCLRKLYEALEEKLLLTLEEQQELEKIEIWGETTLDGSRSDLPFESTYTSWEKVCAEGDTCTHKRCPFYKQCHFFKARKEAQDANILIANHNMLFADLVYRSEDDNYYEPALLPPYRRVILDEAHNMEDVATDFFADRLSLLQMLRTVGRLAAEKKGKSLGKLPQLQKKIYEKYRHEMSDPVTAIHTRFNIDIPAFRRDLLTQIHETFELLADYMEEVVPDESKLRILPSNLASDLWQSDVVPHVQRLIQAIQQFIHPITNLDNEIELLNDEELNERTTGIRHDITALIGRLTAMSDTLARFVSNKQDDNSVRWIESQKLKTMNNIQLINASIDISEKMANSLFNKFPTTVLCSATLTTNKKFDFFRHRLGLTDEHLKSCITTENIYDSPFDYQKQALLAVPSDLPLPSDPEYIDKISDCIWQAIKASHGNAFVLFTSYGMLLSCYKKLSQKLIDNRYNIYKQGDDNRLSLLNKFKEKNYSVLFGTDSFWQGVDVVGDALRCVILVKLPFRVPTEPLIQARAEAITEKGGTPFFDYFVPNAIVKFKQGFGRLIRNKKDRGCIVCLDSRLITKGYGKLFLNSLPPCSRIFVKSDEISSQMKDFYKKTYYLIKN